MQGIIKHLLWEQPTQRLVFAVFVALNVLLMGFSVPQGPYVAAADVAVSMEPARALLEGAGFVHPDGRPYVWGTPLYPVFLAIFLGIFPWQLALYAIVVVQCLLLYSIGLMTRSIAAVFAPKAATLAQLLLIFNPNVLVTAHLLQTEILFTFFLSAGVVMMIRYRDTPSWRTAATVGVLVGLATLVRPVGQFVLLLLPVFFLMFVSKVSRHALIRSAAAGVLAAMVATLVLFPWIARNQQLFGTPFLTANAGMYLEAQYRQLLHNGNGLADADTAVTAEESLARHLAGIGVGKEEMERLPRIEQSRILSACYLNAILDVPVSAHARAMVLGLGELYLAGGVSNLRNYLGIQGRASIVQFQSAAVPSLMDAVSGFLSRINFGYAILLFVGFGYTVAMRIAGIAGLVKMLGSGSLRPTLAILLLIATLTMSYLYLGQSRFRVPMEPYLAVMAAIGISTLRNRLNRGDRRNVGL
jgi:4-amino-4-deoxy-L-arabinose transferase-like glycosyltransferase